MIPHLSSFFNPVFPCLIVPLLWEDHKIIKLMSKTSLKIEINRERDPELLSGRPIQ
jgi:hypothetical protein